MAISLSRLKQASAKKSALKALEAQAQKAATAEGKRKKKSGFWGTVGGALMGAAAVGLTGLTGGLAAPLIMGAASSLGKKWADEASKGGSGSWFGKRFKTPGQIKNVRAAGGFGYGKEAAADINKQLAESRKTDFSARTMLEDIGMSYLSAGLSGGLSSGAKTLLSGKEGSIAKAFGGAEGAVGGWKGVQQALGLRELGISDASTKLTSEELSKSAFVPDGKGAMETLALPEIEQSYEIPGIGQSYEIPGFAQGGQVMDQNTLLGLSILSQMQNGKKANDDTPLESASSPTISEYFGSQNKTLGGSNTKPISQLMG